ncbi:MAG: serine hydrolase [Gammaproteobacteria bacterium]|jgi:D-alanyl-D-alanine endopeptidase (penicillin-binding protein 7)
MMKSVLMSCALCITLTAMTSLAEEKPLQVAKLAPDARALPESPGTTGVWQSLNPKKLKLKSAAALVVDLDGNEVYAKHVDEPHPIASITKLMTAMVTLDGSLPLQERITINKEDRDLIQLTGSRLLYGATLTRGQLLRLALMASENRAANALARTWPGGKTAFVEAMNRKARSLGMQSSHFADPAGLDPGNVASARDVEKMIRASLTYPLIRKATTTRSLSVRPYKGRGPLRYGNTNRLLKNDTWTIQVSKTGYLNEAGRCLAMQVEIADEPLVIVLLNSYGKLTPFGDSNRIRKWIEHGSDG